MWFCCASPLDIRNQKIMDGAWMFTRNGVYHFFLNLASYMFLPVCIGFHLQVLCMLKVVSDKVLESNCPCIHGTFLFDYTFPGTGFCSLQVRSLQARDRWCLGRSCRKANWMGNFWGWGGLLGRLIHSSLSSWDCEPCFRQYPHRALAFCSFLQISGIEAGVMYVLFFGIISHI